MARLIRVRVTDGIAVVTMDAPPVNALSAALRAGLWEVFTRIDQDPAIVGAVLMSGGKMFSAGADIREFGTEGGAAKPSLPEVCDLIEACSKPVVAAVHGQALGGGAEVMIAAHFRIATPEARIGLPEVSLGLLPGAGGTQRLPRLVGAGVALNMMISTNSLDAPIAFRLGLIDRLSNGDLAEQAIEAARQLVAEGAPPRRTCDQRAAFQDGKAYAADIAKARAALAQNPLHAPQRVIECVEAAALLPFEAGLAFEADAFARCLEHPQSTAFRHVFMAERRIDAALIVRDGAAFKPVEPMGKSVVLRLRKAMRAAAEVLKDKGHSPDVIDGAMVAYGFRKGPFGGKDEGRADEVIARRIVAALVSEGGTCVTSGAVQRASDVDVLAVHGLGFPRRHGGPMRAAQSWGLLGLRKEMRAWAEEADIWAVPPLMDDAIKLAGGFDALAG